MRPLAALSALALAGVLAAMALWSWLRFPGVEVPARGAWTIPGVVVVNPGRGRASDRTLVVRGAHIEALRPRAEGDAASPGAESLEGTFALPGLVDLHVHHPPDPGGLGLTELWDLLFLAHGVTAVRDTGVQMSDRAEPLLALRERIARGRLAGPRVFTCGPILDGPDPFLGFFGYADSPDDLRRAIDELAALGVDCIKTCSRLPGAWLETAHDAAAAHGLPLVAHMPADSPLGEARDVDIQHFTGVLGPHPIESLADRWADWDDASAPVRARIVARSRENGLRHTPTLTHFARLSWLAREAPRTPGAELLPRLFRDVVWTRRHGPRRWRAFDDAELAGAEGALPAMRALALELHRAGVPVHAGSDVSMPFLVPGLSLHDELRELVAAGLDPEEVLALATRGAARELRADDLGVLAEGMRADVAFFREDPTGDLEALATLAGVLADGRLYTREHLDRAVAAKRAHHEGWLYDTLATAVARGLF